MTTACVLCRLGLGPNATLLNPSLLDTGGLALSAAVLSLNALVRGLLLVPASLSKLELEPTAGVVTTGVPLVLAPGVVLLDGGETPRRFPLMLMFTFTPIPLDSSCPPGKPPMNAVGKVVGVAPFGLDANGAARVIFALTVGDTIGWCCKDTSDLELILSERASSFICVPACD